MNHASVVINGITYYQPPNGHKKTNFFFKDIFFETEEEAWMAEMLTNNGIKFLHHVNFVFCPDNGRQPIIWCPDFVLETSCLWTGPKESVESPSVNGLLTLGFEVKRTHLKGEPLRRSRALFEKLRIPIFLISRWPLDLYYHHNGKTLPLQPAPAAYY